MPQDKFNYGHAGPGSVSHLVPEVILDGAGMQAVPVPFKGGGPAAAAVAGGHVAVVVSSLAGRQAAGRRQAGQGHGGDQQEALAGDAGRADAAGDSASSSPTWIWNSGGASSCPKGIPEPIRAKLEKALQATMANPAVRERLAKVDTDPSFAPGAGAAGQARERNQELVEVHRRQGHQGRAIDVCWQWSERDGKIDHLVNGASVSVAATARRRCSRCCATSSACAAASSAAAPSNAAPAWC